MSNLKLEINQIKNINNAILEFPIERGIYCLAGSNGCGKSTVMSCLCILRSPAVANAFWNGRFAEHNGRPLLVD